MKTVYIATSSMLVQQAIAYMSIVVLPVAAPVMAVETGLSPSLVGVYSGILHMAAVLAAAAAGGFIARFGGLRVSQVALFIVAAGLLGIGTGIVPLMPPVIFLLGCGLAVSTPASAEILARYSPPRYAPLIFSVKQTGVPVGGMLAGMLVPLLVTSFGWQGAFVGAAAICVSFALLLQPLRADFDRDREPGRPITPFRDAFTNLHRVLTTPRLRELCFAVFTFVGLQAAYASFLVVYLVKEVGFDLAAAGAMFSLSQLAAIPARIMWGWLGSGYVGARLILGCLGVVMAGAAVATGLFDGQWNVVAIGSVAVVYGATAVSWHGVLIAEAMRLAPPGAIGGTTGGVLAFAGLGQSVFPLGISAVVALTGQYSLSFLIAALPAFLIGALLLVPLRKGAEGVRLPP